MCSFMHLFGILPCLGMLRWTLHKRIENNPSHCISLLRVLVKEVEKVSVTGYAFYLFIYFLNGENETCTYHLSEVV